MDCQKALKVLNELVYAKEGRHLAKAEQIVVRAAWEDIDYEEMARKTSYDLDLLQRRVAPKLWLLLTGILGDGEKVTKKRLRGILERRNLDNSRQSLEVELDTPALPLQVGHPPNLAEFYGRAPELAMLKEVVAEDRCVVLFGAAGIGKSALVARLVQNIHADSQLRFERLFWKSIHYAPKLSDLVDWLLGLLIDATEVEKISADSIEAKITLLIEHLGKKRYLLVLDAAEAILQGDRSRRTDLYGEYANYGIFLRRIIEETHQSCLILTSREPFTDIIRLQNSGQATRSIKIEGLGKAGLEILRARKLADEEVWGSLVQSYWGNPLALALVATTIQDFYGGKAGQFLDQKTIIVADIFQETLDHLFKKSKRLTNLEKQIVVYLAQATNVKVDQIVFSSLVSSLKLKGIDSVSGIIEALKVLGELSLIEKFTTNNHEIAFTLQPVVRKYILTDFLVTFPIAC